MCRSPTRAGLPSGYLDITDEMGICVLAETAMGSDGGPKMDSPVFWENCSNIYAYGASRSQPRERLWMGVSNENKPVILHVFNRPE